MKTGTWISKNNSAVFTVWAPLADQVEVELLSAQKKTASMHKDASGYWSAEVQPVAPGARYFYRINGSLQRPDPASFYQPEGVHGPSEVVDHGSFKWNDGAWKGIPLLEYVAYELHAGTFTREGTFDSAAEKLGYLKKLGINAVELMPVAQFPGRRNWGYDGAYPFAVQNSYGGPQGLKNFVNACHENGIAVILDVVYNHLGPEGNYTGDFAPYFTDRYRTPWGRAVNFDGPYSYGTREFFIQNALYWFSNYHVDALRLDAVHGIFDSGAKHILKELSERTQQLSKKSGRTYYLIAESDLNDPRTISGHASGGHGIHAQWNDDFHHCLHALLTAESSGYYRDFGKLEQLAKAFEKGFVYDGEYSEFRKRAHGGALENRCLPNLFVFSQNHDQVGNRMLGERLSALVDIESVKLAASAVLLSPFIPLLFMGEEYSEKNPFLYFVSHGDAELVKKVREGRKKEFESFRWGGELPDPQDESTFNASKLDWEPSKTGKNAVIAGFYEHLIGLRKKMFTASFRKAQRASCVPDGKKGAILVLFKDRRKALCLAMNFGLRKETVKMAFNGRWKKALDSSDRPWSGPGGICGDTIKKGQKLTMNPRSAVIYERI
ncbi:MAG: malto-oligosyltrehalose trehalohydrolase [Endomicrobiales bacterium]|nr:malto-oligosyltrehalose trehalohydrolase [Endomicrobiales bacterium]